MSPERYNVQVVDLEYYQKNINCQDACPVRTSAQGYVNAIAVGDHEAAYSMAREPNPMASTCGRICPAPCEQACRRGAIDKPVTIRALKRFVTDKYGVEAALRSEGFPPPPLARAPANSRTWESTASLMEAARSGPSRQGKVAIVGSGPSGLTAAQDLVLLGYQVTVFELEKEPCGVMMNYIPLYRLPREQVRRDIEAIMGLGVDIKTGQELGRDFTLADLRGQSYRAVLLALGLPLSRKLNLPGAELEGVLLALPFLKAVNREGYRLPPGRTVIVVGGGNVAIDVARSALRAGAAGVRLVCLEAPHEMPAYPWEIEEAREEGIEMNCSWGPKQIIARQGKIAVLECTAVRSVFDESGRFNPSFYEDRCTFVEGDIVILAIGQASDLARLPAAGIPLTERGQLVFNPETMASPVEGVFACGEVVSGPGTTVQAMAAGHRAARRIDEFLLGKTSHIVKRGQMAPVDSRGQLHPNYLFIQRQDPHMGAFVRDWEELEQPYTEAEARTQAERCLRCHIQTVFDGDKCVLCGGCVDVCPQNCYKMVSIGELEGDEDLSALVAARYGVPLDTFHQAEGKGEDTSDWGAAIIKDETACIRCGLCAKRCPVGAITMEALTFEEEIAFEPFSAKGGA